MTSNIDAARRWLDVLATGAVAAWDGLVNAEFSMHAPLMIRI